MPDLVTPPSTLPERDRSLLPSDADVEFYAEHGWYLSKKLFTDDEVDELITASERYYAGERDRTLPLRPPKVAYWEPSDGDVQRHNDYVHYEHDGIARLLRKPVIGAVAAALARTAEIRVFQSTLIYKPPIATEPTNYVPWHFDKHYWSTSTSEAMLTAFIPLHDCDEEMGTITMIDGSHRWRETGRDDTVTRHFAQRDPGQLENVLDRNAAYNNADVVKVPMIIPKGHMSFHHCRTYHGSGTNRSPRPRRAISFHLQDGANAYRRFELSTGKLLEYNHDALVRRLPDGRPDYGDPDFCPVLWRGRTTDGSSQRELEAGHVSLSLGPAAPRNRPPRRAGHRGQANRRQAPAVRGAEQPARDPHVHGAPRLRRVGLHVAAEVAAAQSHLRGSAVGAGRPHRQPPPHQRHRAG